MAIVVEFWPSSIALKPVNELYKEAVQRLKEINQFPAPGAISHVAYFDHQLFRVVDIWDSQESFDAFGKVLMPILKDVGINPHDPVIHTDVVNHVVQVPAVDGKQHAG